MKFSLILATVGRKEEVRNLIESLYLQSYNDYELIIVDQNSDKYVYNLYLDYKDKMQIKYIHSDIRGLSKARNLGLKEVEGEIVAFPDDDCEYPKDILEKVSRFFMENNNYNILTCRSKDKEKNVDSNGKWLKEDTEVTVANVFKTVISYTIFIKYKQLKDIAFDEELGVGAYFGSSEESDMLLNLLHDNYNGQYLSNLFIFHDLKDVDTSREYKYALGFGAALKKEIFMRKNKKYLLKLLINGIIKPLVGIVLYFVTFKANKSKNFLSRLKGVIIGFNEYSA